MYGLENFGVTDNLETVSFKTLYYVNKKDVCTHCNLYNSPMAVPYVLKTDNKIYEIYKCPHCKENYVIENHNNQQSVENIIQAMKAMKEDMK